MSVIIKGLIVLLVIGIFSASVILFSAHATGKYVDDIMPKGDEENADRK